MGLPLFLANVRLQEKMAMAEAARRERNGGCALPLVEISGSRSP